jgi:dihydroxyacetone kinase-like protein
MLRVAEAIESTIEKNESKEIKSFLGDLGWAVMSTDGGSISPLLGSFFLGMSENAEDGKPLNTEQLAALFEAGAAKLRQQTRAREGDKTLVDALAPAVRALRDAADSGLDVAGQLENAAEAAARGADATRDMKAAFGRAKNLGERTLGHRDPGAISMSYLFAGFKEGYTNG